ncbi:FAD-dependent monooxygenase [Occultella gossypii]|uniref:FAD-dependent monooxygenase n=1 Tax=Occultella gossypii TaxID=2800820 RepID=A0ABS7S728_9MICO|nr:FAD-dependent monooxygenase [Occultella gossypii]MBZ2196158.1 FAD-dependent monooxygenase [Occultella gossypii]
MTAARTALVIGGGVAGSAAAVALTRAGIDVTVVETRDRTEPDRGSFLTLATNGIDALRAIGADGRVLEAGFPTAAMTLRSHTGKRLGTTSTGSALADGTVSQTLRRADLVRALRAEVEARGIEIRYGRRLVGLDAGPARVRAEFDDGTVAEADLLVGADGIYSTVRRLALPGSPEPAYSGLVTTGGYAPGLTLASPPGDYEMIFGKRAFFGFAVAPGDEVWWFVNLPRRREPARGELAAVGEAQWRARFAELYADDAGPALEIIAATPDFAPMTPIQTIPRLRPWSSGRVIVIGDAAHAPSPTSGQGASLAIEDAVVLAMSLRDRDGVEEAFAQTETVRRPRVEAIIRTAARINNNKAPGPVGRLVRDAVLPRILGSAMAQNSANQASEHHLDWAAGVTEKTR